MNAGHVAPVGEALRQRGLRLRRLPDEDDFGRLGVKHRLRQCLLLGKTRLEGLEIESRESLDAGKGLIGDIGQ